jgi:2-oxoglutarate ferredoxin oxidoreductase subunit alpha
VNVQRGGPSTGLPTKTEQSDLLQAMYGRNGEAPMPVLAISSPNDAFDTVYEGARIAIEHMTPVVILSDGYIANGAEPWKFPKTKDLPKFDIPFVDPKCEEPFLPYRRNKHGVRPWAPVGTKGFTHRIGGLEKEENTGNVSYDPANHEKMVRQRASKVENIVHSIPKQKINYGTVDDEVLILGWGSTFGSIETAVREMKNDGIPVAHIHIKYLNPFPENLKELLSNFDKIIIPEMNDGQLSKLIRERFLIDVIPLPKIKGLPFTVNEIKDAVLKETDYAY